MATPTDRLRLAPDAHSDTRAVGWGADKLERPRFRGVSSTSELQRGRADTHLSRKCRRCRHTLEEGADMAKTTGTPRTTDSGTRDTGVKITPPKHSVTVTTTRNVA